MHGHPWGVPCESMVSSHGVWQVACELGGSLNIVCGSDAQSPVTLPAVVPVGSEALSAFLLGYSRQEVL